MGTTTQLLETRIAFVQPLTNTLTKLLTTDLISTEVRLHLPKKENPKNYIVEAWSNIKDEKRKSFHSHTLKFHKEENSFLAFRGHIRCTNPGRARIFYRYRKKDQKHWTWLEEQNKRTYAEVDIQPSWITNAIVYNAFVRFFGAKKVEHGKIIRPGTAGTFDHLKKHLKTLKKMGINVLYLNPIHQIGELYRNTNPHDLLPSYLQPGCPYSIKDYKSIDPELAFDTDYEKSHLSDPFKEFKQLVKEAHKLKIRVIMDLVFNHAAHDAVFQRLHPEWFLYKENITSLDDPYIYPEELKQGKPWGDPKHTFAPYDHGYWWEDTAQLNWEYRIPEAPNNPPPNPTLKEMWTYFKSIPKYWVQHLGIDGFRCDVAYRIPPEFWKECIEETRIVAKESYPENGSFDDTVVFIAESYADDLDELQKAGFVAAYSDYSNKLYSPLTLKGYLDYIYNISGTFFPKGSKWFLFPECHDFHRTPQKIAAHHNESEEADCNANKSRYTLTATLPGIPMIFNGFEKIEWHPVNLFSYSSIDWESDKDLTIHITKINKIRNKLIALQQGNYQYLETNQGHNEHTNVFAYLRSYQNQHVLVAVNMNITEHTNAIIYLPEWLIQKKFTLKDHITGKTYKRTETELYIELEPGDAHIFELQ